MRIRPFSSTRLWPERSPRFTLGQFAPSTPANRGSWPRVESKRRRMSGGEMLMAWLATWQVAQLRPFVPRLWKNALRVSILPLALYVATIPAGSTKGSRLNRRVCGAESSWASCARASCGKHAALAASATVAASKDL